LCATIVLQIACQENRCEPTLFALGVMRHVRVTHSRQFTGSVFVGVSMRVRTVGDDLCVFVGQQLRREFLIRSLVEIVPSIAILLALLGFDA
jgi:hypothetical protein